MADRDQATSEADQLTSDRDQAAADREFASHPPSDPAKLRAHEQARADRGEGTMARMATTTVRTEIASERDEQARRRDGAARRRDEIATARDLQAEEVDMAAEKMAAGLGEDNPAAKVAAVARASAAAARTSAAKDRERAARDRDDAARDREMLIGELERAHIDDVTGAYGRQVGEILLRHEVQRAHRTRRPLVLCVLAVGAGVPVETRPAEPDLAILLGDAFLALQAKLRPYDPIVRWSETELVCAVAEAARGGAWRRLDRARSAILEHHAQDSITIGLAELEDEDSLATLIERARTG